MTQSREDIYSLVRLLADGEWHSGESLGRQLGVTRAAVWKRLQQIESMDLIVESVKGQGYRLRQPIQLLDAGKIRASMTAASLTLLDEFFLFSELPSTNQYLMAVSPSDPKSMVCVAERQTAGRGRRGRAWQSPFGANVYLSVRWPCTQGVAALEGLSLAVGVILAEVLTGLGLQGISLKWPNDMLCGGAKLGGILIEVGGDLHGECAVVIGIGLNVNMPNLTAMAIDQPYTDLHSHGVTTERNDLIGRLLDSLLPALAGYSTEGFSSYRERWLACAAYLNQPIELHSAEKLCRGVLCDVDQRGALGVRCEDGIRWVTGGEISMRPQSL